VPVLLSHPGEPAYLILNEFTSSHMDNRQILTSLHDDWANCPGSGLVCAIHQMMKPPGFYEYVVVNKNDVARIDEP
jgi:hypothetical protein